MDNSDCGSFVPPATGLDLSGDEVHVWRAFLNLRSSQIAHLRPTLSTDELARTGRFARERDRDRFIAARGVLRTVLGRYLGIHPEEIAFQYGPHGKPELSAGLSIDTFQFNLSYSHDLALYVIAHSRQVGIDVEHVVPVPEMGHLAQRLFSSGERQALDALDPSHRLEAFFEYWTCKEAYVKARGQGLTLALSQFKVSLGQGEPARLSEVMGEPAEAARWSLRQFSPAPGYVAALAVEGHRWRLACWEFEL